MIYITHEDVRKEKDFINSLQSSRVDGVLISLSRGTHEYSYLAELEQKGLPVVYFDRVPDKEDAITVTTNDYEGGYTATKHLIQQGCKRIAHLLFDTPLSFTKKEIKAICRPCQIMQLAAIRTSLSIEQEIQLRIMQLVMRNV